MRRIPEIAGRVVVAGSGTPAGPAVRAIWRRFGAILLLGDVF